MSKYKWKLLMYGGNYSGYYIKWICNTLPMSDDEQIEANKSVKFARVLYLLDLYE